MGSHDSDERYIVYGGIYVFINTGAWWWPAQAETGRQYLN